MIPLNINGIDVPVKDFELLGEPYVRDGEVFQDASVTFYEPLKYFSVKADLSPKTCLSCGAVTDPYGNIPCGH